MDANYWIEQLALVAHPEGGYFRETYRCAGQISNAEGVQRNVSTAIYFLLKEKEKSHFHRIKSDELWFFHEGQTLLIFVLGDQGLETHYLGKNIDKGESLQVIVPAGKWFASCIKDGGSYALVSCTVAPGFDFADFELARFQDLVLEFPDQEMLLREMCLS
jgi:uncharacterized protein